MLAVLQYRTPAIRHTECLGKRRNLNTSRTGETVSDRARTGRRPVSSNPVPLHHAGPRRAGGSGERQTERTCRRASGETSTRYRFNARDGGVEAGERQARRAPSSHSSACRRGTGPPNAAAPREDGPGLRRQGLRPRLPGRAPPPSLPAGRRARRAGAVRPAPEP